ncbi:C-X-C motif chemokine 11 [Neomonachus schauinslandi]|uniref:C-X-C motif chemokine n=1 Tax=Neomonachus schauinslandi TaxID=29088 RepID=A0A2Y9I774_NEOSC|nr:C-X-C motif chemokine 11 [Neomonachus schauinslandi]
MPVKNFLSRSAFLLPPRRVSTLKQRQQLQKTNMSVKGMVIALAVIVCATIVQGFPMFKGGRCLCIGPGVKAVKVADIEKATIIYPSNNCDKIEVIITLKAHKGRRCLNPKSKQASIIIKKIGRMNFLKYQNV